MNDADRSYLYLAKIFDAPGLGRERFTQALRETALPVWQQLHRDGRLVSLETLRKVGDVELQTSAEPVRDWEYFVLAELAPGVEPTEMIEAEAAAGLIPARYAALGIQSLSDEIVVRPAGAGTAIPQPSPHFAAPPPDQLAAIEYIQIPDGYWEDYHRFMREVMGPVGAQLVRSGRSYRVQILERVRTLHREASLPLWNRIHILWGHFDEPRSGFFAHTNEAIREALGSALDVQEALAPVNRYRIKPRMSKNRRIEELCIGRDATGSVRS